MARLNLKAVEDRVEPLGGRDAYDREFIFELLLAYGKPKGNVTRLRNGSLNVAADAHALDQALHRRMSHVGSDGADFVKRDERAGYRDWTLLGENVADLCYSSDGMLYIIDTPATSLYRREINGDWTNLAGTCLSVAAASATISYVIGADEHLWKNDAGSWTNPENSTAIIDISVSNDGTVYAIRKSDGALLKFNGSGYDVVSSDLAVKEISARDAYHILGIGDADDIVYLWNDVRWASQGVTAASIGISSAG